MSERLSIPASGSPVMPPALLIIHQEQFGYHSDTFYYCKYLSPNFRVTYLCWDYQKKRMALPGVAVIYVSRKGSLLRRNLRFIAAALAQVRKGYAFHFVKYFRGAALVRLLSGKDNFMVDIRSGSTNPRALPRMIYDLILRLETACFPHVSVISRSLKKRLHLPSVTYVLPLGAEVFSLTEKEFSSLNLLYVGTLYSRNIHETLIGFARFYREFKDRISMTYTLIGSGYGNEEAELKTLAVSLGISHCVTVTGYIPRDALPPYFDRHNLGVSYVPVTPYYDAQPPTKNFEYLLSGMPVMATATLENRASVHPDNGIVIQDNPDGFYRGLVSFLENRERFDSSKIRTRAAIHAWDIIVGRLETRLHTLIQLSAPPTAQRTPPQT